MIISETKPIDSPILRYKQREEYWTNIFPIRTLHIYASETENTKLIYLIFLYCFFPVMAFLTIPNHCSFQLYGNKKRILIKKLFQNHNTFKKTKTIQNKYKEKLIKTILVQNNVKFKEFLNKKIGLCEE